MGQCLHLVALHVEPDRHVARGRCVQHREQPAGRLFEALLGGEHRERGCERGDLHRHARLRNRADVVRLEQVVDRPGIGRVGESVHERTQTPRVAIGLGLAVGVLTEHVDCRRGMPPPERTARFCRLSRIGADDELLGHPVDGPPRHCRRKMRPSRHPLGDPEPRPEPARDVGALEFVAEVRLYVGVVTERGECVHEPEKARPELGVVHGRRKKPVGPPGQVEDPCPLAASQICDPPGELLDRCRRQTEADSFSRRYRGASSLLVSRASATRGPGSDQAQPEVCERRRSQAQTDAPSRANRTTPEPIVTSLIPRWFASWPWTRAPSG